MTRVILRASCVYAIVAVLAVYLFTFSYNGWGFAVIAAYCGVTFVLTISLPALRFEFATAYRRYRGAGRIGLFLMLFLAVLVVSIVPGGLVVAMLGWPSARNSPPGRKAI